MGTIKQAVNHLIKSTEIDVVLDKVFLRYCQSVFKNVHSTLQLLYSVKARIFQQEMMWCTSRETNRMSRPRIRGFVELNNRKYREAKESYKSGEDRSWVFNWLSGGGGMR